jgi:hypothetical protein
VRGWRAVGQNHEIGGNSASKNQSIPAGGAVRQKCYETVKKWAPLMFFSARGWNGVWLKH